MRSFWLLNRRFTPLWLGQSVSQLGDAIVEVTLPLWVGLLTHDPTHVALVAATEVLPYLFLGPLAGAAADRWNPRTAMMVCDLLRGVLIGSLLCVPPSVLSWYIYLVSFAIASVSSFFAPAQSVALRLVVEEGEMVRAQALSRATQSMALVLGPALGSTLLLFFGPAVGLLCDTISFGIGAASLLFIHLAHPLTNSPRPTLCLAWQALWSEIADGLRFTMKNRTLVVLLVVSGTTALVSHLWYSVDVFFVQFSLKMPQASVGLLWTISGVGGLVGSLLLLWMGKKHKLETVLLTGLFLRGASLIWYATMTSYAWAVPAALLAGLSDTVLIVALSSLMMEHTKQGMLGRVTAVLETTSALSTLLALVSVSLLKTWLSPWQLLLLCGVAVCVVCLSIAPGLRGTSLPHPSPLR